MALLNPSQVKASDCQAVAVYSEIVMAARQEGFAMGAAQTLGHKEAPIPADAAQRIVLQAYQSPVLSYVPHKVFVIERFKSDMEWRCQHRLARLSLDAQ